MEKIQIGTSSCGHWEFEVQCPIAPPEPESQERSLVSRNLGLTLRRQRCTNISSSLSPDATLEEIYSRVRQSHSTLQRSIAHQVNIDLATDEPDQRPLSMESCTAPNLDGSEDNQSREVNASNVLRIPWTRGTLSPYESNSVAVDQGSSIEVYEEEVPEISAMPRIRVDDSCLDTLLNLWVPRDTVNTERRGPQQRLNKDGYGNENWDPRGDRHEGMRRSPLPKWFPRKPLQDITNVLASGPDDEPFQLKKRIKKVATSAVVLDSSTKMRNASTARPQIPKCSSTKQASTLRKGFR